MINYIYILILFMPAAFLIGLFLRYVKYQSIKRKNVILSQYENPFLLSPVECGYLIDGSISRKELAGTLFDMVNRNLLNYDSDSKMFLLAKNVYNENHTKDFEYIIISELRHKKHMTLDDFMKMDTTFFSTFASEVRKVLFKKSYLTKNSNFNFFWQIRGMSKIFFWAYVFFWLSVIYVSHNTWIPSSDFDSIDRWLIEFVFMVIAIPLILLIIAYINSVLYFYVRGLGIPWQGTKLLDIHWDEIVGYKLYLQVVEAPKYEDKIDSSNVHQAYCVALGLINNY